MTPQTITMLVTSRYIYICNTEWVSAQDFKHAILTGPELYRRTVSKARQSPLTMLTGRAPRRCIPPSDVLISRGVRSPAPSSPHKRSPRAPRAPSHNNSQLPSLKSDSRSRANPKHIPSLRVAHMRSPRVPPKAHGSWRPFSAP
ncbi:hypothetical protein C8Q80DRAFT_450282 [Daedaleopsis nitida]|nr:hypothetical protein C8Q80DRAFT_450282 [Daedaleopsis nitida]